MDINTLCAVLTRALDLRLDVKKCAVTPVRDRPSLINIAIVKEGGGKVTREANAANIAAYDKPMSDLLDEWLGAEPPISGKRDANWMLARAQALAYPPAQAVQLITTRRPTPAAELPEAGDTPIPEPAKPDTAAQAPGSKLKGWEDGHQPLAAPAAVPDPQTAGHVYTDPDTNEVRPMMTRARMIQLGMSREQRYNQYAKQGGPHPDDSK